MFPSSKPFAVTAMAYFPSYMYLFNAILICSPRFWHCLITCKLCGRSSNVTPASLKVLALVKPVSDLSSGKFFVLEYFLSGVSTINLLSFWFVTSLLTLVCDIAVAKAKITIQTKNITTPIKMPPILSDNNDLTPKEAPSTATTNEIISTVFLFIPKLSSFWYIYWQKYISYTKIILERFRLLTIPIFPTIVAAMVGFSFCL